MKIQCFMPVFNEADVLPHVLPYLLSQGVDVHVIDGWSTDGSQEIVQSMAARSLGRITMERFPAEAPDARQVCTDILRRIEDLAAESPADWVYYSDADEWRRSSRPGETLAQAIERVDAAGYNAVDHRVYAFFCTDGGWTGDPETYFRHYNETDCICRLPNRKLWKNGRRVQLLDGGHSVFFPGMRISPERFVMKHYPFRTPAQARLKIETRMARRCAEEHAKGWGVHYDEFRPDSPYCWEPAALKEWPRSI